MTLLGGYGTCVIWMEGGACGEWEWDGGAIRALGTGTTLIGSGAKVTAPKL